MAAVHALHFKQLLRQSLNVRPVRVDKILRADEEPGLVRRLLFRTSRVKAREDFTSALEVRAAVLPRAAIRATPLSDHADAHQDHHALGTAAIPRSHGRIDLVACRTGGAGYAPEQVSIGD